MQNRTDTIPHVILERLIRRHALANVMLILAGSMLIALAAQIAIPVPFSPVPLTMQPLAVLFVGAALGSWRGAAASALYLLEGFAGLPVFAQGHGGPVWMIAATAGYLYSYPAASFIAGRFSERGWGSSTVRAVAGMLVALSVVYLGGWSWLATLTNARAAFTMGVAPFVVADIVKVMIGAALLPSAQRLVSRF